MNMLSVSTYINSAPGFCSKTRLIPVWRIIRPQEATAEEIPILILLEFEGSASVVTSQALLTSSLRSSTTCSNLTIF